jgi:predicted MFS family arabinose efflux permease
MRNGENGGPDAAVKLAATSSSDQAARDPHHASPITNHAAPILTRAFVLTCASGFVMFSSFMLLLAILPVYLKDDLGGGDSEVGLIIGVFAFAALVPRPFIGREIDRGGSKRFLLAGAMIFSISSLLYLRADTIPLLLGVRILHGLGMACFHTAAFAFIAELAPPTRRGEAMGLWGLMSTFSTAIAPYIGLTISDALNIQAVFVVSAVCSLSALGLIAFVREPEREQSVSVRQPGGLFEPSVLTPAIIVLLFTFVYGAVQSFIILYAEQREIGRAGLFFTAFAAAVLVSRLFGGRFADRYGRWAVVLPALAVGIASLLVLARADNLPLLLLTGALWGLSFGAVHPALTALAIDLVPPERRGAGMATFTSAFELGIGSGSILMGLVAAAAGYSTMFLVCAILPTIALVYGYGQARQDRRAPAVATR